MIHVKIGRPEEKKYIRPELHSHFIEFLGSCISGGVWVGKDSAIPNYEGIRKDVVDAMKAIAPPVVRWPGGCYADMYHWRDGVGPQRKVTWNENFGTYEQEKNEFGTHEFMKFCELIGAKPWININMLRGTVAETVEWAEYCNRKEDTTLSRERAANGHPEPFNVEFWGLGNEAWAGGGNYTPEAYFDEYRKYSTAMPAFKPMIPGVQAEGPEMKLIAVGPDGNKPRERVNWTRDLFKEMAKYRAPRINGLDLHFYNWNIKDFSLPETEFDEDDWYHVIYTCLELEDVIKEQYALIEEGLAALPGPEIQDTFTNKPEVKLVVGEWGNWHGKAFLNRPALYQQCTMRDALTSALTLDIFHRNSDKIDMACVAQSFNVLNSVILTDGESMVLTPNYYVFQMYLPHRGGQALEISEDSGLIYEKQGDALKQLYAFASVKDGIITVNLINTSMDSPLEAELELADTEYLGGRVLCAEDPHCFNSPNHPQQVLPREAEAPEKSGMGYRILLPAASVSVYRFQTV